MVKLKDIFDVSLLVNLYCFEIDNIEYDCNKISIQKIYLSINIGCNYKPFLFNLESKIEMINDYSFSIFDIEYKQTRIFKIKVKEYIKINKCSSMVE